MSAIQSLDFHGYPLQSWQDDASAKIYVAMRELCRQVGLNWAGQQQKLLQGHLYKHGLSRMAIHTPGGPQEVLGLDLDLLPAWLMSISPDRVSPEIKTTLILFQKESTQALREYWTTGIALNPRSTELTTAGDLLVQMAQAYRDQERRLQQTEIQAREAHANALRAIETQLFFTVAEYITFERFTTKIPPSDYRRISDHLKLYCLDRGIPFRRIPVGGQRWDEEYGFHISVWTDALPGWLARRDGQTTLQIIHAQS